MSIILRIEGSEGRDDRWNWIKTRSMEKLRPSDSRWMGRRCGAKATFNHPGWLFFTLLSLLNSKIRAPYRRCNTPIKQRPFRWRTRTLLHMATWTKGCFGTLFQFFFVFFFSCVLTFIVFSSDSHTLCSSLQFGLRETIKFGYKFQETLTF